VQAGTAEPTNRQLKRVAAAPHLEPVLCEHEDALITEALDPASVAAAASVVMSGMHSHQQHFASLPMHDIGS
jgi:hypothetical protein